VALASAREKPSQANRGPKNRGRSRESKFFKGRVVAAAEPNAKHRNPFGTVHGGLAATLLDSCMGLAVLSKLDKGLAQTTLDFKISLVRPITPQTGLVKAEGKVIRCGHRVGTAEGKLTDKDGRVLAHSTTTCLVFEHKQ
jgi:uncharacterized protein (TIGR00369 family)